MLSPIQPVLGNPTITFPMVLVATQILALRLFSKSFQTPCHPNEIPVRQKKSRENVSNTLK